jgi:hypothetical protein
MATYQVAARMSVWTRGVGAGGSQHTCGDSAFGGGVEEPEYCRRKATRNDAVRNSNREASIGATGSAADWR